jgi:hypothetical protein
VVDAGAEVCGGVAAVAVDLLDLLEELLAVFEGAAGDVDAVVDGVLTDTRSGPPAGSV